MHCPDTFEPHIPSNATSGLPLPDEKGFHPASCPVTLTSCNPFGLQPNRFPFPSLPEKQDPSPCGNQGHFSLLPLQSLFPTGLVDSLCSRVAPCVTLHSRWPLPNSSDPAWRVSFTRSGRVRVLRISGPKSANPPVARFYLRLGRDTSALRSLPSLDSSS